MKRTLLILLAVVVMAGLLAGCKGKATPTPIAMPVPTATPVYAQWEYQAVMMQCLPDNGTGTMACYVIKDNDNTSLEGYLKTAGNQGWELVQVIQHDQGGKNGGYVTALFKRMRASLAPTAAATAKP